MVKTGWLGQRFQPVNYLLSSLVICLAVAESPPGHTDQIEPSAAHGNRGQMTEKRRKLAPSWGWADRDFTPLMIAESPQALAPAVINVEDLPPPAPVSFETDDAPLQGTNSRTLTDSEPALPAIAPRDLETPALDFNPSIAIPYQPETQAFEIEDYIPEPEPNTLVQVTAAVGTPADELVAWRATVWGGVMTDNDLGDSLTFQDIELEDSGLIGLGISRQVGGGNTITVEGELQLFRHFGRQDHFEGTAALALRWELSPSFSIALIEGLSYATALPEIEDDNNTDESSFLNYLALEVEFAYTPEWAIAGRLHHRSGAARQFGNAIGGSNAYLLGVRRRF